MEVTYSRKIPKVGYWLVIDNHMANDANKDRDLCIFLIFFLIFDGVAAWSAICGHSWWNCVDHLGLGPETAINC